MFVQCSFVEGLIKAEEAEGIPSNRVLIAGFSQGGAVSLLMLRSKVRLAAVLAMSTWLPLANQQPILSTENQQTPVLMCHGNADQVVGDLTTWALKAAVTAHYAVQLMMTLFCKCMRACCCF